MNRLMLFSFSGAVVCRSPSLDSGLRYLSITMPPKPSDKKGKTTATSGSPAATSTKPSATRRISIDSPLGNHKTRSMSRTKSDSEASLPGSPMTEKTTTDKDKKKPLKNACPCNGSSSGKDWKLKCLQCGQLRHAGCVNLKGTRTLSEAIINQIFVGWLCPWCFKCPYTKPGGHTSSTMESSLVEKTLSTSILEKLSDTVTVALQSSFPTVNITALQEKLENLSQEIKEYRDDGSASRVSSNRQTPGAAELIPPPLPPPKPLKPTEKPYQNFIENYITRDDFEALNDLVGHLKDDGHFFEERGHQVLLFGESYTYAGSRLPDTTPEPIPHEIAALIEKVTNDLSLKHKPNSVLINLYPANDSGNESHLAMHSDDEKSIVPDSSIITISLWSSRKIVFESKHHDQGEPIISELTATANSLYSMTRSSQNWYRHGVPPPPSGEEVEERVSITLRCVSSKANRSILLMGDSNTKDIQFGTGSGKVGDSYPGKRVKASRVKNIDPVECVGYQNVFLHVGTNDLRCEYVTSKEYVHQLISTLQSKLVDIKQLCPDSTIYVVPVLPTRNGAMNQHITYYNNLVSDMLDSYFPDVWFEGMYHFLDRQGLLDAKLTRSGDDIHLGRKGIGLYVSLMKKCVFRNLKLKQYSRTAQDSAQVMDPLGDT